MSESLRKASRNGGIDIMRVVFCFIIIFYHINNRVDFPLFENFTFFKNGKIGVEFFFLVSGFLLAADARSLSGETVKLTQRYIKKKLLYILPYHLPAFFITLAALLIIERPAGKEALFERVVNSLPNLFFIEKSGIRNQAVISAEWYIGAMLLMMLIIYPLVLQYRERFTRLAAPIITIILIGYMIHSNNKLGGMERFLIGDMIPKAYIRAFAEMTGGVFCYEAAQKLKTVRFSKPDRIALSFAELVCYVLPIGYAVSGWNVHYEAYAFYSLCIAVTLSFSGLSLWSQFFNHPVVYGLGKLSFPLYLAQGFAFAVWKLPVVQQMNIIYQSVFCVFVSVAFSLFLEIVSKLLSSAINKKQKLMTGFSV